MVDIVDQKAKIGFGNIPFKGIYISYGQFKIKKVVRRTDYKNQIPFVEGITMTMDYLNFSWERYNYRSILKNQYLYIHYHNGGMVA